MTEAACAETPAELLEAVAVDFQPGGHLVPAVGFEAVGAGLKGPGEVEAGDRPAASLAVAVLQRDHDGGTMVPLDDPAGDDPDYPRVPFLVAENDGASAVGVQLQVGHLLDGLFEDSLFRRLAVAVLRLQESGGLRGPAGVSRRKHLDGKPGMAHPTGGVEPRPEPEANVVAVQVLPGEPRRGDEGAHPDELALLEPAEPEIRQRSVLAGKRHHVGDGAQRRQRRRVDQEGAECIAHLAASADGNADAPCQLVRHPGAAERRVGVRRAVVVQARVDDGVTLREESCRGRVGSSEWGSGE